MKQRTKEQLHDELLNKAGFTDEELSKMTEDEMALHLRKHFKFHTQYAIPIKANFNEYIAEGKEPFFTSFSDWVKYAKRLTYRQWLICAQKGLLPERELNNHHYNNSDVY